jgi:hypothetical protein
MRFPAILAVVLALFPVACNTDTSAPVGQSLDVPLLTDDATVVGNVNVANSETALMVTLTTSAGWTFEKVRWAVGTELRHIPQTRGGEPIPGRFPFQRHSEAGATLETWRLPLIVEPGTVLTFAVNADVKIKASKDDKSAPDPAHEGDDENCIVASSWGEGTPFPKMKGSMYFTYTVQASAPPSLVGLYRTHTQEQWSSDTNDKPTAYMTANFSTVFPNGITLGVSGGFTAVFTSAAAIGAFLPESGTPGPLGGNWVNPTTLGNSLAGNTLALMLNTGFDAADPNYAPGTPPLRELVVADPSSPFYGLVVGKVQVLANQLLSGRTDLPFTAEQLNEAALKINMTFKDGIVDLGFLSLP